jgi:hypothetical protein
MFKVAASDRIAAPYSGSASVKMRSAQSSNALSYRLWQVERKEAK